MNYIFSRQSSVHDKLLEGGNFDDSFEDPEKIVYNNTFAEHVAYLDTIKQGIRQPRNLEQGLAGIPLANKRKDDKYSKEQIEKNYQSNQQRFRNKGYIFWLNGIEVKGAKKATFQGYDNNSWFRFNVVWLVNQKWFDMFIIACILFNSVLMGAKDYTDYEDVTPVNRFIVQTNPIFNTIIYVECILKIIAMGFYFGQHTYLSEAWNWLDFFVVASSLMDDIMSLVSSGQGAAKGLSSLRAVRLLRPLRLLGKVPSIKILITTLLNSIAGLGGIMGLAMFFFSIFSILGMTVWSGRIHYRCYLDPEPSDGEWPLLPNYTSLCSSNAACPDYQGKETFCRSRFEAFNPDGSRYKFNNPDLWADTYIEELFWGLNNFDNIGFALVTVFQVMTMDGWTPMMNFYENAGSQGFSFIYFISCVIICSFFILNLTVAQMIMKYDEITNESHVHEQYEQELRDSADDIFDDDHKEIIDFIIEEDKAQISPHAAKYLSKKQSFIQSFFTAQKIEINEESKYYRNSIVKKCLTIARSKEFNGFIIIVIILNTIALSMDKYPEYPEDTLKYFSYFNIAFTVVFTIEAAIKLIALGLIPFMSEGFNVFDLFIVMSSIFQIYLEYTGASTKGGLILILRTLRVFRIFKLFKVGDLRMLIDSITYTIPVIGPYVILLSFFMYIFALVAMSFYAGKIKFDDNGKVDVVNGTTVRENYNDLFQSFLTIFQVLMGAEWRFIWYQHMLACGMTASLYYVGLHIVIGIIMLNLFLAIMLGNFDKARAAHAKKQIFDAFRELLHEREDMYSMHQVCDIVMGDMSEHIKNNILNLGKEPPSKLKLDAIGLPMLGMQQREDYEDEQPQEIKMSYFQNYSLGIFHIDNKIRRICLKLAVEKTTYDELNRQRQMIQHGNQEGMLLTAAQMDYRQRKRKPSTDWYKIFDNIVLVAILVSSAMLPLENPVSDPKSKAVIYAKKANLIFTVFFLFELTVKSIGQGFFYSSIDIIEPYMASGWNRIDAFVVFISMIQLLCLILGIQNQYPWLKAMRALRALRPLRVIRRSETLRVVVNALLSTVGAVGNVMLVGFLLLLMFAVMGINLLKGSLYSCSIGGPDIQTKQDCLDAGGSWNNNDSNFDNITQAMRTLFILCTTEGWAGLMFMAIDSRGIDMQPLQDYNPYMSIYFIIVMITGSLFIMNMFVGVVIDNFNKIKEKEELGSSYVTEDQRQWLIYQQIGQQKALKTKIKEPNNFRKYFFRFIMHPHFDNFITAVVATNTLFMAIKSYQMTNLVKLVLDYANYVFAIIFNFEMIIKLCALGNQYFISSWNKFDMFIVITADFGILLDMLELNKSFQSVATILRAFRIVRIVRLLQKFRSIKIIIDSTLNILPSITNVLSLLALILYVYACFGIYLFAGVKRRAELDSQNNFSSFGRAMLGLVRYSTGEDFQEFMYEFSATSNCVEEQTYEDIQKNGYQGCGSWISIPYFISFTVIAGWLILNLTIAAVIDGLQAAQADDNRLFKSSDIDTFLDMWQEYDHNGVGTISLRKFYLLLAEVKAPFGTGDVECESIKPHEYQKPDPSYLYNYERKFKVQKGKLLYDILNLQLKVSLSAEDEILIEFSEAYKGLIKRSFEINGTKNYKLQDEKANKKLIKGWQKKSRSNRNADTQTAVSKEDKNYLTQYLAALIIQQANVEYAKKKAKRKADKNDDNMPNFTIHEKQKEKMSPSELIIFEPRIQPQNVVKTLDDEFYEMRNQKAKRVFLNSCNKFALNKIKKNMFSAQDYMFSRRDFQQRHINCLSIEKQMNSIKGCIESISDSEISSYFKVESIKISPDVIFVNDKLIILVKAWQKVSFQQAKFKSYVDLIKNDPQQKRKLLKKHTTMGNFEKKVLKRMETTDLALLDDKDQKAVTFYIKTLQFFDFQGKPLKYEAQDLSSKFNESNKSQDLDSFTENVIETKRRNTGDQPQEFEKQKKHNKHMPILIEQVSDIPAYDDIFYDVSFLHNGSKIYYFKRIYFNEGQLHPDPNTKKYAVSKLQLYSYDLVTGTEDIIQNISLLEYQKRDSDYQTELSVIFSKQFGRNHKSYADENDFLSKQFFLTQKYEKGRQFLNKISLYSMKSLGTNWKDDQIYISQDYTFYDNDIGRHINCQATSINHKELYKGDKTNIYFIVTNMQASVQITYDKNTHQVSFDELGKQQPKVFLRDDMSATNTFLWNQSEIKIQGMDIKSFNEQDEQETIEQYFFVDTRNQIQLVFPNYELKAMRHKIKRLIMEQTNIMQLPYTKYKKINCLSYNCNPYHGIECESDSDDEEEGECHHRYHNIVQKIDDLTATLDYDVIFKDHQLTFCNSKEDQILFISEMDSRQINLFSMKQIRTIICEHTKCSKTILKTVQDSLVQRIDDEMHKNDKEVFKSKFRRIKEGIVEKARQFQYNLRQGNSEKDDNSMIDEQGHEQSKFDEQELLCTNDRKEEYLNNIDQDELKKLSQEERINHVLIDDFKGKKVKVKVFEILNDDMKHKMRVKLVRHQPSSLYACFVFAVYSIPDKPENEQVTSIDVIKQYVIVTKNNYEMNTLFGSNSNKCLIDEDDEVQVLKSCFETQNVPWHVIRAFQLQKVKSDIIVEDLLKDDMNELGDLIPFRKIKLTFPKQLRKKANINFLSFIYQESQNTENNSFINFDIFQNCMTAPINISPSNESKAYLYQDEQGFNSFQLCRTSDVYEQVDTVKSFGQEKKMKRQMVRYVFFFLFSEKIGRLQGEEFLITHSKQGMIIQTIGHKEIIMSKAIIEKCEWGFLKNSFCESYMNKLEIIIGTTLVFQVSQDEVSKIAILEQEDPDKPGNNQYVYQSDVVLVGHQKFQLFPDDDQQFIIVTSCMLRNHFIQTRKFTRDEAYYVLQQCMKNILTMRICTLDFLVLNTFEDMRKDSFFQPQEILNGKSLCDISLNDTQAVKNSLRDRVVDDFVCPGSIIDSLVRDDQVRKQTFKEILFYPKTMIVHYDLNFIGTIERAIRFKYFISLRMLIDHIFDEINTNDYNSQIMCALPCIILQKQVNINQFFRMSQSEKKDRDKKSFCNIEISFQSVDLPIFSDMESDHIINWSMDKFHKLEEQLANLIMNRERQKSNNSKNYIVEHTYIDFTSLIIGEKIRRRFEENISFDDIYLSQLFLKFGNLNKTIYQQDSIQKIIDYQWVQTRKIMKWSFYIYVALYCLPISFLIFSDDDRVHQAMLQIALLPALLLFLVEIIQIKEQGMEYFGGWNICDFTQFMIFFIIFLFNQFGIEDTFVIMPELRILLVILSLIKLLFFLRVFEEYGFLVQIIISCCIDLIPFITFYMIALFMFSIIFVVLNMEIDVENNMLRHVGFFQKMLMETFRSSIGEVGLPKYTAIVNEPYSKCGQLNQILIWVAWFVQVFFMLVIMLNFLIAVLQQTYNRVMNYQKIILYQQRSELNEECYNLLSIFLRIKQFKYIVFSTNKDIKKDQNHNFAEISENIQQYVTRDKKAILQGHEELKQKLIQCKDSQKILEKKLDKNFVDISKKFDTVGEELNAKVRNNNK